ncbi:peptidoglycan-binding protein [Streptomyces sp. S.PNR 29]|uniref:peptidoglycan-binding protein n=1 Tax=Streptomyces sp. S.PNR 29 TaxID=2973805 RepID=UPI0025B11785|nr:peptidoglycan-binding protein [Streptomyces sp. S.PNR 29]MDN0201135.1 peptidoglycan-binding protein [Streptomyces sp. S.PNR 29]
MTSHDESEARPSPGGDGSGALERRTSHEMASQQAGAVATASDDERSLARRDDEEHTPVAAGEGGGDGTPEAPAAGRKRRGLRRALILLAAIAVAAAAGIAATGALGGDGGDSGSAAPTAPPATAKVQRTTLTDTQTVDGNLGYGSATTVQAPAAQSGTGSANGNGQQAQGGSGSSGIITWLPDEGRVLKRGDAVYRVNEQKVPLLYGSFPLYRTLQTGSEGADVEMLEKNLDALGYDGFTVDDEYTSGTAEAVREWQDDLGREETGTVSPGDAVVASGARRVASLQTVPGAAVSGAVLSWTDTERIVSVDLDVAYEDLVDEGTKATVELPDNSTVEAEVTDIGTPTSAGDDSGEGGGSGDSGSGGSSGSDDATLPVELTVKDPKGLGRYQAAAVEVTLKADSRKNVLAVPVEALMARQGGGYALEVVTDGGTEMRPVKLGMFANGMVEVSGTGITEGTVVGVPK